MLYKLFISLFIFITQSHILCAKAATLTKPQLIQQTLRHMVFVKGGSFIMGNGGNNYKHRVILDNFYINKYTTTYLEYDTYSKLTHKPLIQQMLLFMHWRHGGFPVGTSDWQQAKAYCRWLRQQTGLAFDLPTEAQWEYAARSRGKQVNYATNTGKLNIGVNYPNYSTHPQKVGLYPPNPLGLYDMSGNVNEWVNDWYDLNYYNHSQLLNPQGPTTGKEKVLRGDSYLESPQGSSVYMRFHDRPKAKRQFHGMPLINYAYGFRCVINQ